MKTEFRIYRESDYFDLSDMVFSLYREDPEGEPIDEEKIRRTIAEFRKCPEKGNIYLFQKGEETVGYAILVFFWSNEYGGNILTVDELFIKKEYRGRGIGTEFLAFAGRMENKAAMQLETTPSNQRALDYYRRLGFAVIGNAHLIRKP